jgi:hypothetical protein
MSVTTALLIAGAVVVLAILAGILARVQDGRRRSGGRVRMRPEDVPSGVVDSELCARCPQVRRLLGEIAADRGIPHGEIDLTTRSDLATRYHVLQTPTTFLIDASGAVVARWGGVPDRRSIVDAVAALSAHSQPDLRAPASQKQEQS